MIKQLVALALILVSCFSVAAIDVGLTIQTSMYISREKLNFVNEFIDNQRSELISFSQPIFSYSYNCMCASGDVNCDNNVDINDAVSIVYYVRNIKTLTFEEFCMADFNHDGKVNFRDVAELTNSFK